jgi:predicted dehydrogenase
MARTDIKLVAIVEPDEQLVTQAMERHKLPRSVFVPKLEPLLATGGVDAVVGFNMTYEHRELVETCAKHGVHVMVEKPLAVNLEHARAIEAAAKKGNIHVLVNYEPIWSAAYQRAFALAHEEKKIGELRRILAFDGNDGPVGKSPPEFVRWLLDPKLNGGGALMDFGCYGSAMACWLLDNERPVAVTATVQNLKPKEYTRVEDDSTIILTYRHATAVIMGSWDWPIARKEFEVYGAKGYVAASFPTTVRMRLGAKEQTVPAGEAPADWSDPLTYFCGVARGKITPSGPSSLQTNLLVVEILDAAREAARTGKRVDLPPK